MLPLLTAAQMREVEDQTSRNLGLPEILLMEHAAIAVAKSIENRFGSLLPQTRGVILAGPGNNGADAMAAARVLVSQGCQQILLILVGGGKSPTKLNELQRSVLGKLGIAATTDLTPEVLEACDWVIDGIFGAGLNREVTGDFKKAIEILGGFSGKRWIVSVDIPSGISSDTGNALGRAVLASETVALGFYKRGLCTGEAADHVGKLSLASIQIPRSVPFPVDCFRYTREDALRLPSRKQASHKGDFGHVFVSAGAEDKQGACILTALGALRSGVGLTTVVGNKSDVDSVRARLTPEIMTAEWGSSFFSEPKGVLVMGPGFGLSSDRKALLSSALCSPWPLVLDADALTLLAEMKEKGPELLKKRKTVTTVMTPHPKEAARLLGITVEEVQEDRFRSVELLAAKFSSVVLLKGRGTLIRSPQGPTVVVSEGNSGLAKGGTGDLLSGILAALLAQGTVPNQAVPLGAYLHGRSSEILTHRWGQERSFLPSEIGEALGLVWKDLSS